MDRSGQRRYLIFAAAALSLAGSVLAQPAIGFREEAWLARETRLEALTREPSLDREALFRAALANGLGEAYGSPDQLRADLIAGELLFRAPLLLGGQAAKAGMSCHSCHVNGRGNPHFQFPAISSRPGTADTTHSFFSETLGNGVFDPVTIPDLTREGKVDHGGSDEALERFIGSIVVEEFAGSQRSEPAIRPIATFVRALRFLPPERATARQTRSLQRDFKTAALAISEAHQRADNGEGEVAALLLSAAQSVLRDMHERLIREEHKAQRRWIVAVARHAGEARQSLALHPEASETARERLKRLQTSLGKAPDFAGIESATLYNSGRMAAYLTR